MLRKTTAVSPTTAPLANASMRPQRNAAENSEVISIYRLGQHASMRPQRNAAENQWLARFNPVAYRASMRPQRNAAENRVKEEK